jgi:hypothetical protein
MPWNFGKTFAAAMMVALACAPTTSALADGHFGGHGWGLGRGVVGAAVALATLPLVIASEVLTGGQPAGAYGPGPGYAEPPPEYYAPPAYYPPAAYYGGPQGYYRPAPYYARPRGGYYEQPRGYHEPRSRYYPGSHGDHATRPDRYGRR